MQPTLTMKDIGIENTFNFSDSCVHISLVQLRYNDYRYSVEFERCSQYQRVT